MPFAAFIGNILSSIAGFFGIWLSKKVAFGAAAVATYAGLSVAIVAVVMASISGLQSAFIGMGGLPASFMLGFLYFMPDNLNAALGVVVAARVSVSVYQWNVIALKLVSTI